MRRLQGGQERHLHRARRQVHRDDSPAPSARLILFSACRDAVNSVFGTTSSSFCKGDGSGKLSVTAFDFLNHFMIDAKNDCLL